MDGLFLVVAFLAEVVGTVAGFGSSMVLLPVALLFFDFKTALVLVAIMHLFGNLGRVTFFHKKIAWRVVAYFGVIGVVTTFIGAWLATRLDHGALTLGLGIFLIAYSLFALSKPRLGTRQTKAAMLVGGAASGFLAGIIGTGGAIRSAFLTAFALPKTQYIGTAAVIAIAVDGTRIPLYISDGLLTSPYYWMIPVLLVLALAGSYVGKKIVTHIPQPAFAKIVLLCLMAAGGSFVVGYFVG